jgi:hypothetical protein
MGRIVCKLILKISTLQENDMAGLLQVVENDTKLAMMQILVNTNTPLDITNYTISCRVGTSPTTTVVAQIIDAVNGEAGFDFSGLPDGTWKAEILIQDADGLVTSEQFTIMVRPHL